MAEYVQGLDNREGERSGHNNNEQQQARGRVGGVDFNVVNYEQRRGPYGNSRSVDREGRDHGRDGNNSSGPLREDV